MTEEEARAEVVRKAQTGLEPALTEAEIDAALASARRYTTWTASSEVEYGARVVPTTKNGHRYRAVQGGTTGATEPSWGTTDYSRVTDGTVIWEEDGVSGEEWDVRSAVFAALQMRYAKDQLVDFSADGRNVHGSQRSDRIQELMKMYRPVGIA